MSDEGSPRGGATGDGEEEPPHRPAGHRAEEQAARALSGYLALGGAIVLHVMVGALLPVTVALAPRWALGVSVAAWVVAAVLIWRWHRRRPIITLLVPFGLLAVWYGALQLGGAWLDWGG
jgi:hypothetical protein